MAHGDHHQDHADTMEQIAHAALHRALARGAAGDAMADFLEELVNTDILDIDTPTGATAFALLEDWRRVRGATS